MSLLRSFSFGHFHGITELPDDVLSLFTGLLDDPGKHVKYASEIISAGLQGNIDFGREFNIDAYEAAITRNQQFNTSRKRKKETFLDFGSGDDGDDVQHGGVRVDIASLSNALQMEDAYEQLMSEDELRYAISAIKSLQPVLMVEARMDILYTMKQALRGIPDSVKMLKKLCEEYEILGEQIKVVLGSGYSFEEMFASP